MYAAVVVFVLMGFTAPINADHHHQPCHSPNMTGLMSVMTMNGDIRAQGNFVYDSHSKKLRFRSNESYPMNTSRGLDLLVFFEQGILYEIDSKNQNCEKKKLQNLQHPLDIPDDAKFYAKITSGAASVEGEGLKLNIWAGSIPNVKGYYSMSITMGCLPLTTFYFTDTTSLLFSNMDVELEIKDPDLLVVPLFCHEQSMENKTEEKMNSFLDEFM